MCLRGQQVKSFLTTYVARISNSATSATIPIAGERAIELNTIDDIVCNLNWATRLRVLRPHIKGSVAAAWHSSVVEYLVTVYK